MPVRMTHRERVLAAVDRQETDRTPIDFGGTLATTIMPSTYKKFKDHLGETHPTTTGWKRQQLVLPAETILRRFDVDTRPLKLGNYDGGKARVLSTHQMIDHWGTTWSKEVGGHYLNVDGPFYKTEADPALIEAYDWPDPDNPGLYRGLKKQAEELHDSTDYAVILDLGIGIVTRARFVRGFMEFLIDMTLQPEFAKALLSKLGQIWIRFENQFGKDFKNWKASFNTNIPSTNYVGCCYRNDIFTKSCRISETSNYAVRAFYTESRRQKHAAIHP